MQNVTESARSSRGSHRLRPSDLPLPEHLSHLQGCLYFFAVAKVASSTFVRSGFDDLFSDRKLQKAVLHDCMRLHSSMWSAVSVSTGACRGLSAVPQSRCTVAT